MEIIQELLGELPPPTQHVGQGYLTQTLTAVDGSVVKTLATLAEAAYLRDKNGQAHGGWRLHTHFAVDRGVPVRIDVTGALNGGKTDEKQVLRQKLKARSLLCAGPLVCGEEPSRMRLKRLLVSAGRLRMMREFALAWTRC